MGNMKLACMLQDKGLSAHPDKTCFIVFGNNTFKQKIEKELKKSPLMFGKFKVTQRVYDRYLGQTLHSGGLSSSSLATVEDRAGKIKGAALEIKSIIEEFEMQAMGGLMVAWELWYKALIPSLLSGAGTWLGNIEETAKACERCSTLFLEGCFIRSRIMPKTSSKN